MLAAGPNNTKKILYSKRMDEFFLFFALLFVCLFRAFAKPKVTQPSRVELVLFFHSSPACSLSNRTSYAWAGDSDRLGRREKFYFFLLLVFGRFSAHMRENELEIGLERGQDRSETDFRLRKLISPEACGCSFSVDKKFF